MNQWNALNVNVIKTKRIECVKLNLPAALTRSLESCTKRSSKLSTTETENLHSSSQESKQSLSKIHSSGDSLISPEILSAEDSFISSVTEDEVFQESLETPPDEESSFSKSSTKRCSSLPAYLSSESYHNSSQPVCFHPRRLFEEALNLETVRTARSNRVSSRVKNQSSADYTFPREQEKCILKEKQSGTTHAERMKRNESSLINFDGNFDNNNNLSSYPSNLEAKAESKKDFDARDWEQKVLVLTSDYDFGTESSKKPREECDNRSRSVALTGNISTIASDQRLKDQNVEREVKSETESKSEMPKLQTVVWNYLKRKSTKRKRKTDTSHLEKQENKGQQKKESCSENVENRDIEGCKDFPSDVKSFATDSAGQISGNNTEVASGMSKSSRSMKPWKSTPNLRSTCDPENYPKIALQRYNSFTLMCPQLNHKSPPELPALERKVTSESLTFMLTTATEEKSMEERMQTLKLSREWLLKELKSMREEDRRLARQFIHLRCAIVEMKEYCEKEEIEYDSDSEGLAQTIIDTKNLHIENKRSGVKERKIQMHDTPTINILNYC